MSEPQSPDADASPDTNTQSPDRRNVLIDLITGFISFVLIAVPSAIGGIFFLDPLLRKKESDDGGNSGADMAGFIRLPVSADVIPDDGTPFAVTVRTDLDDAWNHFSDVPVGSIWLRKNPNGEIMVFNSVCPHLGCSVNYRRSENDFFCPCHTSSFRSGRQKDQRSAAARHGLAGAQTRNKWCAGSKRQRTLGQISKLPRRKGREDSGLEAAVLQTFFQQHQTTANAAKGRHNEGTYRLA